MDTKQQFMEDVFSNFIADKIKSILKDKMRIGVSPSEVAAWNNSLGYMQRIMNDPEIPGDVGIAIEFNIPQTSKRIDFILTGMSQNYKRTAIIIELKQWEKVEATTKDGVVSTFIGGSHREVSHPSYQSWSYKALLEDFNEAVRSTPINVISCAYLHNCESEIEIKNPFYNAHLERSPSFLKSDAKKLQDFIKTHVKYGDKGDCMYLINRGQIIPSKIIGG